MFLQSILMGNFVLRRGEERRGGQFAAEDTELKSNICGPGKDWLEIDLGTK